MSSARRGTRRIPAGGGGEPRRTNPQIKAALGSSGRRNVVGECIGWGGVVECLPGAGVEFVGDGVQVRLGVAGAVVSLGKYWRSRPLVFSLLPRGQGLCGSQK